MKLKIKQGYILNLYSSGYRVRHLHPGQVEIGRILEDYVVFYRQDNKAINKLRITKDLLHKQRTSMFYLT